MGSDPVILVAVIVNLLSIGVLNFAAISVTKEMSATTRVVLGNLRTIVVWAISLALQWQKFHVVQLLGFAFLISGLYYFSCLYSRVYITCLEHINIKAHLCTTTSCSCLCIVNTRWNATSIQKTTHPKAQNWSTARMTTKPDSISSICYMLKEYWYINKLRFLNLFNSGIQMAQDFVVKTSVFFILNRKRSIRFLHSVCSIEQLSKWNDWLSFYYFWILNNFI